MRARVGVQAALLVAATAIGLAGQESTRDSGLVGTWVLVSQEEQHGTDSPLALHNPRGLLIHDAAGHALEIVTQSGRPAYRDTEPTPEEAARAFATYSGFWGSVVVDPKRATLSYAIRGAVDPNRIGRTEVFAYELSDNRLVVTQSAGDAGGSRKTRTVWERARNLATMTPLQRQLVGFWEWKAEARIDSTGRIVASSTRTPSVIVYTPTGHMAVHFGPGVRQPFVGQMPTAVEARAAVTGYVSYFGSYGLYVDGWLQHFLLVHLNPALSGQTNQRLLNLTEPTATLTFPPSMLNGVEVRNRVTIRRLSGLAEMSQSAQRQP